MTIWGWGGGGETCPFCVAKTCNSVCFQNVSIVWEGPGVGPPHQGWVVSGLIDCAFPFVKRNLAWKLAIFLHCEFTSVGKFELFLHICPPPCEQITRTGHGIFHSSNRTFSKGLLVNDINWSAAKHAPHCHFHGPSVQVRDDVPSEHVLVVQNSMFSVAKLGIAKPRNLGIFSKLEPPRHLTRETTRAEPCNS